MSRVRRLPERPDSLSVYHKINGIPHNPITVAPEAFALQQVYLRTNDCVISLAVLLDSLEGGRPLPSRAVLLTFNGYLKTKTWISLQIRRPVAAASSPGCDPAVPLTRQKARLRNGRVPLDDAFVDPARRPTGRGAASDRRECSLPKRDSKGKEGVEWLTFRPSSSNAALP